MRSRKARSWNVRSPIRLKSALMVSSFLPILFGGAALHGGEPQSARFEFGLIGDMPYDARHEKEFANVMKAMNAANLAWMRQAFELARRSDSKAIMMIAQADPRFENTWPADVQQRYMLAGLGFESPKTRRATGFDDFLAALEKKTAAFGKPVVYVHGDTHIFRVDKPLFGSTSRRSIENFTRVATFGHPDTHWVRAIVDPTDPQVFSFRPEIVKENLVNHGSKSP